ncbi:MAG: VWA domain-containing protein [Actinobacteria bacterium]|nr:VWA domain-containing protein [Actinomycetota bacterium]
MSAVGIPLADAELLRPEVRRTRLLQVALAVVLLTCLCVALLQATRTPVHHSSFFPAGERGVVVIDFSTSIAEPGYRRISNILRPVVNANQPIGVVFFSDVAYVALPPGTPGRELRSFLRFLRTLPALGRFPTAQQLRQAQEAQLRERRTPWSAAFRGGTRISTGLAAARRAIEREGAASTGTVLLISDLDDSPFDLAALAEELALYRRAGLDLRVVPLFPADTDRAYFRQALGPGAFVSHTELLRNARSTERRSLQADYPLVVSVLALALLGLLAVNEVACGRLDWRREQVVAR